MNIIGPTGKARIVQVHPTRFCNLRCLHCYSQSGPEERDTLDITLLCQFLEDAAEEGYNVLAVSGGEPLLYPPLRELLIQARSWGFTTTLTTNGMLLTERKVKELEDVIDLIAISLDGIPESHNYLRGSANAFAKMSSRLEGVRQAGIPFGFIFTLTQYNVNEVQWVAKFALEQGAKLLQIHPLEMTGRAITELSDAWPDALEQLFASLEAAQIETAAANRLKVQLDLINRHLLHTNPTAIYAELLSNNIEYLPLAELVSPLIVETDGTLSPLTHGFPRDYSLGNLKSIPLRELVPYWKVHRLPAFQSLCQAVYEQETQADKQTPFFNWYETMAKTAAAPT